LGIGIWSEEVHRFIRISIIIIIGKLLLCIVFRLSIANNYCPSESPQSSNASWRESTKEDSQQNI
jgi:hypothetical protein